MGIWWLLLLARGMWAINLGCTGRHSPPQMFSLLEGGREQDPHISESEKVKVRNLKVKVFSARGREGARSTYLRKLESENETFESEKVKVFSAQGSKFHISQKVRK